MEDRGQSTQLSDDNNTGKNLAVDETLRDPLPHSAPHYNQLFWKKKILNKYNNYLHPEVIEKPHQCDACPKACKYPSKLKQQTFRVLYVRSHDMPQKCRKCHYDCKTESDLKQHLKTHERNRERSKCSKCGKYYIRKGELNRHWKEAHVCLNNGGNVECDNLQGNNEEGSVHTPADQQPNPSLPHPCQDCGRSFGTQQGLHVHITFQHPEVTRKPHKCHACQKEFAFASVLKRHLEQVHIRDGTYGCSKCTFYCKTERVLKSHWKIHDLSVGSIKCSICDKEYLTKNGLNYHLKTVHDSLSNKANTENHNTEYSGDEKECHGRGSRGIVEATPGNTPIDVSQVDQNRHGTVDHLRTEPHPRSETTENAVPLAGWVGYSGNIHFSQEYQEKHSEENQKSDGAIKEAGTATENACGETSQGVPFSFYSAQNELFTSSGPCNAQRENSGGIAEASPENISTVVSQGAHNELLRVDHRPSAGADCTEFPFGKWDCHCGNVYASPVDLRKHWVEDHK